MAAKTISRSIYQLIGFVFLALAIAGVLLPLLPTTPFLLLSAGCFARSSEKWHGRLLANPTFGPMIKNWEEHRCISLRTKTVAILMMGLVGGYSIFVAIENDIIKVFGGILITIGLITVLRIKTCATRD